MLTSTPATSQAAWETEALSRREVNSWAGAEPTPQRPASPSTQQCWSTCAEPMPQHPALPAHRDTSPELTPQHSQHLPKCGDVGSPGAVFDVPPWAGSSCHSCPGWTHRPQSVHWRCPQPSLPFRVSQARPVPVKQQLTLPREAWGEARGSNAQITSWPQAKVIRLSIRSPVQLPTQQMLLVS